MSCAVYNIVQFMDKSNIVIFTTTLAIFGTFKRQYLPPQKNYSVMWLTIYLLL